MTRRLATFALGCVLLTGAVPASADAPAAMQAPGRPVALNGGPSTATALISIASQAMPLVVPAAPDLREATTVLVGDGWYATTTRHGGVVVTLHALRAAHQHVGLRAEVEDSGSLAPIRIHESHAIWSAAWEIGDIALVVDLECEQGPADPRCLSETFLLDWVNALLVGGGAQ